MTANSCTNVDELEELDQLEESYFEKEVERLDVSDGPMPFVLLKLTSKGKDNFPTNDGTVPSTCFLGKETSDNNVKFYRQKKSATKKSRNDDGEIGSLLEKYTFECVGILTLQEENRTLLVLKNPFGSNTKPRLLELKMKAKEHFHLERFHGQPQALTSRDPYHDWKVTKKSREGSFEANSEAQRAVFRKMKLDEVIMHYLNIHEEPDGEMQTSVESLQVEDLENTKFSKSEVTEIVLNETVLKLGRLLSICETASPQNWQGSSIVIGYETGNFFPDSDSAEQEIRSNVIVRIFDWDESELKSEEEYEAMCTERRKSLDNDWDSFKAGIHNLLFHAAKRYHNQFSTLHDSAWNTITVRVLDYDSSTKDDFIGEVTIFPDKDQESDSHSLKKKGTSKKETDSADGKRKNRGCIELKTVYKKVSRTSRLSGSWHITISKASELPIKDLYSRSSDPYCLVTASTEGEDGESGYLEFQQQTKVFVRTLCPEFEETLEIPVMKKTHLAESLSRSLNLVIDPLEAKDLFGTCSNDDSKVRAANNRMSLLRKK